LPIDYAGVTISPFRIIERPGDESGPEDAVGSVRVPRSRLLGARVHERLPMARSA